MCDISQSGKLNKEQFAIAMWLIKQKLNGIDPPASLTPEMIPPSIRKPGETIVVTLLKYFFLMCYNMLYLKQVLSFYPSRIIQTHHFTNCR